MAKPGISDQAIVQIARDSYGRLLALLASKTGDIMAAEDVLADAFLQALHTWPVNGVPSNPDAWLYRVARNSQINQFRSAYHQRSEFFDEMPEISAGVSDESLFPDQRLALMFVCAHPAIDAYIRSPLMLQVVLGLEVKTIAQAYVLPEATLAQRLVRAKRRIRSAKMPFSLPEPQSIATRLDDVLEAIYGAYAINWMAVSAASFRHSLAHEALYLATLLSELLPDEPEVLGLAALMSLSLVRQDARSEQGEFVSLARQDTQKWNTELFRQGEAWLHLAHEKGKIGRFQLEAAIQSAHCHAALSGKTDWHLLQQFYTALINIAPTLGARVSLAVILAETQSAQSALDYLDSLDCPTTRRFQPWWATRAEMLKQTGNQSEAQAAYFKAASLSTDPGSRQYLQKQAEQLKL